MEKDKLIVFLDMELREIKVYSNGGFKRFSFFTTDELNKYLGESQVIYITNAKIVKKENLISLVKSINDKIDEEEDLYVHAPKGGLIIPIKSLDKNIEFKNPISFMSMKELENYNNYNKTSSFKSLLSKGILDIKNEKQMNNFIENHQKTYIKGRRAVSKVEGKSIMDIIRPEDEINAESPLSMGKGQNNENSLI